MKNLIKKLTLCFIITTALGNLIYAQQQRSFTVKAEIKGLPSKLKLGLFTLNKTGGADTLNITQSKEGGFVFNLNTKQLTIGKIHYIYFIDLDTNVFNPKTNAPLILVIDAPSIKISGNSSEWPALDINGSAATKVYENYQNANNKYKNELEKWIKLYENRLPQGKAAKMSLEDFIRDLLVRADSLGNNFKQAYYDRRKFVEDYIKTNKNSPIVPSLIKNAHALNLDEKQNAYNSLPEQIKSSFYGKELVKYIADERHIAMVEKRQAELAVGKQMPDFKISSDTGKIISVLDIVSKSEYTLIDFWASWCVPCRDAIPKIKEVYDAYYPKGFNVLAISTDKKEADWRGALEQEKTQWTNGLDNIDVAGKNIFGLAAIPAYILLDKSGVIVRTDYFSGKGGTQILKQGEKTLGNDLKEIVAELFKGK